MPATDPTDQQAARAIELLLRDAPQNIEILRAPEPTAWHGLGCRKKRSRAFESIGRAYNARQRLSGSDPIENTQSSDTFLLHPSSCYVPKRSPTPPGLRDAIRNVPGLIHTAIGPANAADYGLPTPLTPGSPNANSPAPPVVPPPEFPHDPQPEDFIVDGHDISPGFSYVVAYGRHSRAPEMGYSTQRAAFNVHAMEGRFPGALDYLAKLFFPAGVHKYGQMVDAEGMDSLLDFVFGWFEMSRRAREYRLTNPSPPRPSSSSSSSSNPREPPQERNEDEYERLLNSPIEEVQRAAARDPMLGFFFRVLDNIKDQLLEGITAQIQVQENQQETGVQTLNTTLQQMTNSISKTGVTMDNVRQQVESAAQNAWTAANSAQKAINEQIKTQNYIDKLSQQMDTIVIAMVAMGKEVSASLNKQKEAIEKLKADTETLQETLQVVEERVSATDIMDQHHQWEPEAKSSQAQVPKWPKGLFPGDNPPGPPSGPPLRENTPHPRTPEKPNRRKPPRTKSLKELGKRGQEAESFLMKMEIYFNNYGTAFNNNQKMATFLTNMGEGEAAQWAKPLLRKILDEEPHKYLTNWNTLKNAFLLGSSDPMKKERAIQNIHKLQQTGSAQHYVTAFQTLMQELNWDEHLS
ncbi:Retrotransposon gag protein [Ceratobasidium sp. AG-Ba]|nr:Retrotransposon gag protein [Ceratobasidium sp. AG-Ba]